MKRAILILLSLFLFLTGCSQTVQKPPESTPEPTPNPLEAYIGDWTWEQGDGSIVWELYEDGRFLVPEQTYDTYRKLAGFGTWRIVDDCLVITLAEDISMQIVEEDGFVKLYCPLLNQTLVRCEDREAAYGAKFVDVKLTSENFWDYFQLEQVPSPVDENGDRIYKEVFVFRNGKYDDGLIYWSESNVSVDLVYWWTYRLHMDKAPYGTAVYVDYYNFTEAEGILTFIRSDHVAKHSYDGAVRKVVANSGETMTETFDSFRYGEYPY